MITTLYTFDQDRQVTGCYSTSRRDIYNVPVAIANGDIEYSYRVDVHLPKPYDFWSKDYSEYTVGLGDNAEYIRYAAQFGAILSDHPYNPEWKLATFKSEYDAFILTRYIAIQETRATLAANEVSA